MPGGGQPPTAQCRSALERQGVLSGCAVGATLMMLRGWWFLQRWPSGRPPGVVLLVRARESQPVVTGAPASGRLKSEGPPGLTVIRNSQDAGRGCELPGRRPSP
jgi:hypothetical protein